MGSEQEVKHRFCIFGRLFQTASQKLHIGLQPTSTDKMFEKNSSFQVK